MTFSSAQRQLIALDFLQEQNGSLGQHLRDLDPVNAQLGFASIDDSGVIDYANPAFELLLQFRENAPGIKLEDQIRESFSDSLAEVKNSLLSPNASVIFLKSATKDVLLRLRIDVLQDKHRVLVIESQQYLAALSDENDSDADLEFLDPLTKLGNRKKLGEIVKSWQQDSTVQQLGVLMLDLDHFKHVNDTLGHESGDKLLLLVAERIKRAIRPSDILIRLGGDEFLILQHMEESHTGLDIIAQRLVELLKRPFLVKGQQVNVGVSVGAATFEQKSTDVNRILKHVDLALYAAKAAGRGTFHFFNAGLEHQAIQKRELEIRLRRALDLKEFRLLYQPQIDLRSNAITGFEALIRWHQPDHGMIAPADFIPLAEETGEITSIGEWVLRSACQEATNWPQHLCVAVNVSPVQFNSSHFLESVHRALYLSGLDPMRLEIEITEGVLVSDIECALRQLNELKSLGVGIAMDDFGTGYSSLNYLSSFPFSKLKIDQSFVNGEQSPKNRALVNAIISLGDSLGMQTLAEGVETEDQYNMLHKGGCKHAQGFLISKPLSPDLLPEFIADFEYPQRARTRGNE